MHKRQSWSTFRRSKRSLPDQRGHEPATNPVTFQSEIFSPVFSTQSLLWRAAGQRRRMIQSTLGHL
jgi:hypothetical protein